MKQILPSAKLRPPTVLLIIVLVLLAPACATLPRQPSTEVHLALPHVAQASLVNINTAAAEELAKLPGIGKVIAERIIAHRQQFGPFRRAEHLMMVRGISDRKFRAISAMIGVD